jgi:hypothetical protein
LSATEIDTLFANFCEVTGVQDFQISFKLAILDSINIFWHVELLVIDDVVSNSLALNPRSLLSIGNSSCDFNWRKCLAIGVLNHVGLNGFGFKLVQLFIITFTSAVRIDLLL